MRNLLKVVAGGALAMTACGFHQEMVSEAGEFKLAVEGLQVPQDYLAAGYWEKPYLVLAGTRMCPELQCVACADLETCNTAAISASGPVEADDGGCFTALAPGEVTLSVGPECGGMGPGSDVVKMRVIAPEQTDAVAYREYDSMVARHLRREVPMLETLGAPWVEALPPTLKVVAGQQVSLNVDLFERASGHPVARQSEPAAEVQWTTTAGRPPVTYPSPNLGLVAFEGTEAAASFEFAGHTWPLGQVIGVPAASATSLELAGALLTADDPNALLPTPVTVPVLARVVARDAAGDLLVGLPVRWSADAGEMAYVPDGSAADHLVLTDECVPPDERPGPREFVLRASHGELSATVDFTWAGTREPVLALVGDGGDEWVRPDFCIAPEEEGCGCRSSDPAGLSLLALGLLALGRRRRNRRANPSSRFGKNMSLGTCLLLLPLVGCSEDPPAVAAAEVLPLGTIPLDFSPYDGGHSVLVHGRSVWSFHAASDRPMYAYSGAAVTDDLDASDGLYPLTPYNSGVGLGGEALLVLRADEHDEPTEWDPDAELDPCHEAGTCPSIALRPGPMVHDPERARILVFYTKLILRSSAAREYVGSSIAVWRDDLAARPVRPDVAAGSAEPSLLFGAEGPRLAAAALAEDDHVYAFACDGKNNPCVLLRAPLDNPLAPGAWQFYDGTGGWSGSYRRARKLFNGAPVMSVHHSAYADAYLAVHAAADGASVVVHTAPRLEGPWSESAEIYRPAVTNIPLATRDAVLHPELARADGAIDYLTHGIHSDDFGFGLQLVEIHWE